jgi:hypothetical protein
VPVSIFSLFLSFAEKEYQTESKRNKTFVMIFLGPEDTPETWSSSQKSHEAATRGEGAPPTLWAPRDPPDLVLPPIYSHIFPNHQKHPRKHFSTAATFCSREIPSWGLFRHPVGGGFGHGGLLHQLYCPFDEAWVVYLRPTGPSLVARWLLLSLWFSICSPWCSWRSIRCNLLLRCVCQDPMNCGFMISLSMNIIWIFSEFFYAWFIIFVFLFELSVWFGQLDWFFLRWERCFALGSILWCPHPVTVGAARHILYCCHRG